MVRHPLDPDSPTRLITLRLPARLLATVDAKAKQRGEDRSATIRAALEAFCARNGGKAR